MQEFSEVGPFSLPRTLPLMQPVGLVVYLFAGALALDGVLVGGLGHEDVHCDILYPVGLHQLVGHDDVAFVWVNTFASEEFVFCCEQN